jgi:hypothetical protein
MFNLNIFFNIILVSDKYTTSFSSLRQGRERNSAHAISYFKIYSMYLYEK